MEKEATEKIKYLYSEMKFNLMRLANWELSTRTSGLKFATKQLTSKAIEELMQEQGINKPVFSDYCSLLGHKGKFENIKFLAEELPRLRNSALNYKAEFDFFDGNFRFSDNQKDFQTQFRVFMLLFEHIVADSNDEEWLAEGHYHSTLFSDLQENKILGLPEKDDPELDLIAMEALFYAGKMIERLKYEGEKRSDRPAKAGRSPWKNKIDKQEVIETYYRIDTKDKSKNAICEAVRDALVSQEAKRGKKKRDVYSVKQIRRILKEELEKIS